MKKIEEVAKILRKIRDRGREARDDCCISLLELLEYNETNALFSVDKMHALLIKATKECFGTPRDIDIVLMAFGLMQGYDYEKIPKIKDRRDKYLRESDYLQACYRPKIGAFDAASMEEQGNARESLRRTGEDTRIDTLAEFLLNQHIVDYANDLSDYMITLPKPSYYLSDTDETEAKGDHDKISPIVVKITNIIGAGGSRPEKGDNAWVKLPKGTISITISVIVLLLVCIPIALRYSQPPTSTGAGAGIRVPTEQLVMQSGKVYEIKPLFLAETSEIVENVHFEYESSDSSILKVLDDGLLYAQNDLAVGESASVELTVRGPNDTTKKVTITVENSKDEENLPIDTDDIESFVIAYTIENQVRLVGGDKTWGNGVEAKIGDIVEFRVAYMNNDTVNHMNVMISDILPDGLHYVPGSTILVNSTYSEGGSVDQDDIFTRGINIGGYTPGSNAFVRFRAEVIDSNLEYGSNTLVNWAQGGVNGAVLQDYATVHVYKE